MNDRRPREGFTAVELLVVLAAVGVLMVVMPIAFGITHPHHHGSGIMKESVNLRNIHLGMETYAATNKDYFPGLTGKGDYVSARFRGEYHGAMPNARDPGEETGGAGCTLSTGTNLAMAQLLEEGLVAPAQLISPGETGLTSRGAAAPMIQAIAPDTTANQKVEPAGMMATETPTGEFKDHHFSFAMLAYGRASLKPEWKSNQNPQAVVMATRLIFGDRPNAFSSVWTEKGGGTWKGAVVRGDTSTQTEAFSTGHVDSFENLKYGDFKIKSAQTESANAVGVFGRSADMANFDASEKTGMIGSVND